MKKALIAAIVLASTPAQAGTSEMVMRNQCVDRLGALIMLETLSMVRIARGLSVHGYVDEMWQAPDGGYMMIIRRPDGMMCVATRGDGLELTGAVPGRES